MLQRLQRADASVHKLFDHLDIALSSCADLRRGNPPSGDDGAFPMRAELTAITHLLQARELVKEFALSDLDVLNEASRFLDVTAPLEAAGAAVEPMPRYSTMLGRRVAIREIAEATAGIVTAIEGRYASAA
jgi:hypothetical protein